MQYQPHNSQPAASNQKAGATSLIRKHANIIGLGTVMITAISFLSAVLFSFTIPVILSLVPYSGHELLRYSLSLIVYCIILGVPCALISVLLRIPHQVAFPTRAPKMDILISAVFISLGLRIVGGLLVDRLSAFIEKLTGLVPQAPNMPVPQGTFSYIVYFISIAVAPAIFEEALFRGVIMQSLRRFGDYFAVVVSSVLFAVVHGNLIQGPYSFLLGLLIGYFVIYTGSIWTGVVIHFANNAIAVILESLINNVDAYTLNLIYGLFLLLSVLLGISAIIYIKVKYGSLFYLKRGNFPIADNRKFPAFFSSVTIILTILFALYESWGSLA